MLLVQDVVLMKTLGPENIFMNQYERAESSLQII